MLRIAYRLAVSGALIHFGATGGLLSCFAALADSLANSGWSLGSLIEVWEPMRLACWLALRQYTP